MPVPEDELSPEEERRRSRVGNGIAADARRNVDRGRTANANASTSAAARRARPPMPSGHVGVDDLVRREHPSAPSDVPEGQTPLEDVDAFEDENDTEENAARDEHEHDFEGAEGLAAEEETSRGFPEVATTGSRGDSWRSGDARGSGSIKLPEGYIRARPGEKGAMRAADAAAAGLVATDAGVAAGLRESSGDSPDKPPEENARLRRIAARIRGDAPVKPPRIGAAATGAGGLRAGLRRARVAAEKGSRADAPGRYAAGGGFERGRRDRDGEIRVGGCHPGLEVRLSRLARRLAERGAIVSGCRLGCHLGCRLGCRLARRRVACPPRGRGGGVGVCARRRRGRD